MKNYMFRALQLCTIIITTFLATSCSKKSGCYYSATTPIEINRTTIQSLSTFEPSGSYQADHQIKSCALVYE